MNDLEISKALALAIGWKPEQMFIEDGWRLRCYRNDRQFSWQVFDYRDPAVIWPIAAKYNLFPYKLHTGWEAVRYLPDLKADTPEKAAALAVIRSVK